MNENEFLDDLDDLGGSDEEDEEENLAKKQRLADDLADLDSEEDDDEDDVGDKQIDDKERYPTSSSSSFSSSSGGYQALVQKIRNGMGIQSIINIRKSDKFLQHMSSIEQAQQKNTQAFSISGRLEDDYDYQMIVASNRIVVELGDEFDCIHRYVAEKYSKKFPELEGLIPNKLDFVKTVQRIGNEMDMTLVDLNDLLPSALVMVVSVTGSTTSGQPLPDEVLSEIIVGCEEVIALEDVKNKILDFIESRMNKIAPNVSVITGTRLAAQLIGITGGLVPLSKIPSCNLQVIGQEKKYLSGFSKVAAMPHSGLLYYCDLVQNVPPYLRKKLLKVVAAKVSLAARVDSYKNFPNGEEGRKLRQEIEEKSAKLQEPDKARTKKALPIPEEKKRNKRGGKRVRRFKERFAMTELRKAQNKLSTTAKDEYGDSAMGLDQGMVGHGDSNKILAPTEKKTKFKLPKSKMKAINAGSSGVSNGLSSTLVFSTVQGMELAANQPSAAERVKEANSKWFNQSSGFLSAAPSALPKSDGMVLK